MVIGELREHLGHFRCGGGRRVLIGQRREDIGIRVVAVVVVAGAVVGGRRAAPQRVAHLRLQLLDARVLAARSSELADDEDISAAAGAPVLDGRA